MSLTFTQEADFRKEREFGQKISATFDFIRVHWRPLGRVLLYTVVPAALVYGLVSSALQVTLLKQSLQTLSGEQVGMKMNWNLTAAMMGSPAYWVNAVLSVAFLSLVILSVYGYVLCCLRGPEAAGASPAGGQFGDNQFRSRELGGGEFGGSELGGGGGFGRAEIAASDVWAIIRREYLSTVLALLGLYVVVVLGLLVLVIPGLYLSVTLSLFFIVKLVEGTGFGDTIGRCWGLIKGKWWSTFGLIFVMTLLLYALLALAGIIGSLLGGSVLSVLRTGSAAPSALFTVVTTTLTTGLTLLFYPPLLLVLAFQYFNLVERREGVGLRGLVGQLGQAAPTVSNATYRADEEGEY